jgi:hypothetical protein
MVSEETGGRPRKVTLVIQRNGAGPRMSDGRPLRLITGPGSGTRTLRQSECYTRNSLRAAPLDKQGGAVKQYRPTTYQTLNCLTSSFWIGLPAGGGTVFIVTRFPKAPRFQVKSRSCWAPSLAAQNAGCVSLAYW